MRNVIVSNLISLDGYIEGPHRELDWFTLSQDFFAYARELTGSVDTMLYGRVTYQMMESYWAGHVGTDDNDAFITTRMNEVPKVVFSRTLKQVGWGKWDNARLSSDPVATVRKMKTEKGGDMVIFGSGGLVSTLAPHGLIDEYRMIVNPVILGRGQPMFRGLTDRIKLQLTGSRQFTSGTVMLYYHPAA